MFLGLQVACDPIGFCLLDETERVVYSQQQALHSSVSETLVQDIHHACQVVGSSFSKLSGICITSGPGAYTSLRIGIACANTLSHLSKIPLYGVSVFEAILAPYKGMDGLYIVMIPARKQELSLAILGCDGGKVNIQHQFSVLSYAQAHRFLQRFQKKVHILTSLPEFLLPNEYACLPSAVSVAQLGFHRYRSQESSQYPICPVYAYDSV